MAEEPDENETKTTTWLGFTFDGNTPWGLLILFFATGYMGLAGEDAGAAAAYQHARPVAKTASGHPVHVTGPLSAPDLGSEFVKPGKYLRIVQRSEVYALEETRRSRSLTVGLEWTASPKDPATFFDTKHRHEVFHKKTLDPRPVSADARIVEDGKEYRFDPADVDFAADLPLVPPARDALSRPEWGVTAMEGRDTLVLYKTKACADHPVSGCERVVLSVLPRPEGTLTLVGDLKDGHLVKHGDTLKGARGDYKALLRAFDVASAISSTATLAQRFACLLGMWFGLWMARRPLRRLLGGVAYLRDGGPPKTSLAVAGALALPAYLLHANALFLAIAIVVVLLAACREPRPARAAD